MMLANYSVIMMIKQSDRKGIHSTFTSDYYVTLIRIIELFCLSTILMIYSSLTSFFIHSFMHFKLSTQMVPYHGPLLLSYNVRPLPPFFFFFLIS